MDENQRLHLQKMISANNVEDQTGLIRDLKHSHILRENVNNLVMLKAKYPDDADSLNLEAMSECNFLFTYYTDLYNKIRKDEIDLKILFQFIDVLANPEIPLIVLIFKLVVPNAVEKDSGLFIIT